MAGRESLLKLNDKTVALVGRFSSLTQMLLTFLTEQGADVAIVDKASPEARRFCEHINDQREIKPYFGRAGVVTSELSQSTEAGDIINRVVHSFGRLDCMVDMLPCERTELELSKALASESLKFLTSRQRSRILWLVHHPTLQPTPQMHSQLRQMRHDFAQQYAAKNLTANELILGVTEEYLLRKSPKSPSIKQAFEELKKELPTARLLDPGDVAAWVMFLASPLSQAVNGQALFVDHGLNFVDA